MALEKFAHVATTTVVSGGTSAPAAGTIETWTVLSSAAFPDISDHASEFRVVDAVGYTEVMRVTAVSGVTWTVVRGVDSTTPVAHAANFTVSNVISSNTISKLAARPLPVSEAMAFMSAMQTVNAPGTLAYPPRSITVIGDSTGNGDDEWAVLFTLWLMAQYPQYTVETRLWNDTRGGYDPPVLRQTGTAGLGKYTSVGATTDRNFNVIDSVANSVTGDQTIDFKLKFGGLPAGAFDLLSKFGGAGQRSWRILFTTTGTLQFSTTSDGTTEVTKVSTAAVPLAQRNAATWYRARIDVDNGAAGNTVSFWYSSDYVTWTQLGANVVTAGITSVFDSTAPYILNGRGSSQIQLPIEFYALRVYSGITDATMTPVVDMDVAQFYSYNNAMNTNFPGMCNETVTGFTTTTGAFSGSPVLTLFNGSHPGAGFPYLNTNFAAMTPYPSDLFIISSGYNDIDPSTYRTNYNTMINAIKAKYPNAGIICTAQSLSTTPGVVQTTVNGRGACNEMVPSIAALNRVGCVNVWKAITDLPNPAQYVLDGTHPTQAGSIIWAEVLKRLFIPHL